MDFLTMALRLLLAFALSGIVGWEREYVHKPAGLRTLILVGSGAALFVLVTLSVVESYLTLPQPDTVRFDVARIIAGIAGGVGFLGAGTTFVTRGSVHGLTTAAAIWAVAAIGVACGFGEWEIALLGTGLTFIVLRVLLPVARSTRPPNRE